MGKVMRHTLGASLNIRHNLSSSKGPKPLQLKLLTTYIPKTDRKSGSAGMPRPISYAVFCLKKKKYYIFLRCFTQSDIVLLISKYCYEILFYYIYIYINLLVFFSLC